MRNGFADTKTAFHNTFRQFVCFLVVLLIAAHWICSAGGWRERVGSVAAGLQK